MLSRLTYNIELVAEAATNSVTVMIRDSLTIVALIGWLFYLNWQLTLTCADGRADHLLAAAAREPPVSPLQHAHPEFHGRCHACGEGGD